MRVIVGCEYSQIVCQVFRDKGHEAFSCDIEPTDGNPDWHFQEDIFEVLKRERFDLGIFFPPCTYLTVTGNKWMKPEYADRFPTRREDREKAIEFFMKCVHAPIEEIAIENPVGIMSSVYRKPDQIIHPYYFGDAESKKTCLWLKNLRPLYHVRKDTLFEQQTFVEPEFVTYNCASNKSGVSKFGKAWQMSPSPERTKLRSKTFAGIAKAMAEQWG